MESLKNVYLPDRCKWSRQFFVLDIHTFTVSIPLVFNARSNTGLSSCWVRVTVVASSLHNLVLGDCVGSRDCVACGLRRERQTTSASATGVTRS